MNRVFKAILQSRYFLISALLAVLALSLLLAFSLKRPLLLVLDEASLAIYSQRRVKSETYILRFRLLRPVKTVIVDPLAESSTIIAAIMAVSSRPAVVVFPRRYEATAMVFANRFPMIPLAVHNDSETAYRDRPNLVYVSADRASDFYRAGRSLAYYLANSDLGKSEFAPEADLSEFEASTLAVDYSRSARAIAVFRTDRDKDFDSAVQNGLKDGGYTGSVQFLDDWAAVQQPWLATAFAPGSAQLLEASSYRSPFVLFSWVDPDLLPDNAILVFDDSLMSLAETAFYAARAGISVVKSSKVHLGPALKKLGLKEAALIWQ